VYKQSHSTWLARTDMLANEALQQLLHVQLLHDTVRIQIKTNVNAQKCPHEPVDQGLSSACSSGRQDSASDGARRAPMSALRA
jgi:hypothetical protein